jgi:hypothetical protein
MLMSFMAMDAVQIDQPKGCRAHARWYFMETTVWQTTAVFLCSLPRIIEDGGRTMGPWEANNDTNSHDYRARQYGRRAG